MIQPAIMLHAICAIAGDPKRQVQYPQFLLQAVDCGGGDCRNVQFRLVKLLCPPIHIQEDIFWVRVMNSTKNAALHCRPLTAAVAVAGRGKFVLDGVPRMRERPIQDLVDGLQGLGVDVQCTLGTGCPPVEINAEGIRPGKVALTLIWPA